MSECVCTNTSQQHVPVAHDGRVTGPLLSEDVLNDMLVFGHMGSVYPVVPRRGLVELYANRDTGPTYAVMKDHGCAYFCASMKGIA